MKKLMVSCLVLFIGCSNLHKDYVDADEQTYKVIAPAVEKWLTMEPGLVIRPGEDAESAKAAWEVKLRSWKFRIDKAKQLIEEE